MKKILATSVFALSVGLASQGVQAQSLDYSMMESLFGEPVTTSANGSPQRQSEVALNMEILTAEDIERSGARTLPEVLRFLPGLSVRQMSFGQTEVGIRGYNQASSERILVLVNGRQVYTDSFGQVVWDNIPVEMNEIKQIEVVKGPNTALFGFNAVSGVINIITINPLYDDLKEFSVTGGTHSLAEGSAVVAHKFNDGKIGVKMTAGGYQSTEAFDDYPLTIADDSNRASFSLDVWGQVTDKIQAQFEATKNQNNRNEYVAVRVPAAVQYDTNSVRGRVLADTGIGLVEADVYHNETRSDYNFYMGAASGTAQMQGDNRITIAKLNDTFELGTSHIFRVGGEYREASNIYAPIDGDDLSYNIWSASSLWDWRATDKIRTSAALRYDRFELDPDGNNVNSIFAGMNATPFTQEDYSQVREEVSYNLGVVYQATPKDTFRATTSRGADLPSFTEFGLQFLEQANAVNPRNDATIGDPDVDTSIVTNYELGYDRKVEQIDGLFRAAVFYQTSKDMQGFGAVIDTVAGPIDRSFINNIGDSSMYGTELSVQGKIKTNWDWFLNYTYVDIDDDFNNMSGGVYVSPTMYEDSVAKHVISGHIGYTADKWRADLFAQYVSGFDDLVEQDTASNLYAVQHVDGEVMINANFAYDITDKLTWSVSGYSLTGDTEQSTYSDAERQVWTSLSYKF